MALKLGYDNLYRAVTNGHMGFRSNRIPPKCSAIILGIEVRQEAVSRIAVNPPSYPFKMSLPWHAILVTRWCEALGTMWKRTEP
jgi:hypothetical protein